MNEMVENLRDALIADVIIGIEKMDREDLIRELICFKAEPLERMSSKELFALRRQQVEDSLRKHGCYDE